MKMPTVDLQRRYTHVNIYIAIIITITIIIIIIIIIIILINFACEFSSARVLRFSATNLRSSLVLISRSPFIHDDKYMYKPPPPLNKKRKSAKLQEQSISK